jgi:selenocysteine lyase/cysteine desulfurase
MGSTPGVRIMAPAHRNRLSVFSFYFENYHYNLVVKLLNDHFGIQTRGGCSCAGTYGHFLLNVDRDKSYQIKHQIQEGCNTDKPGWVRLSLHPTMTNDEIQFICESIKSLARNIEEWSKDYRYDMRKNDYVHLSERPVEEDLVHQWFDL